MIIACQYGQQFISFHSHLTTLIRLLVIPHHNWKKEKNEVKTKEGGQHKHEWNL